MIDAAIFPKRLTSFPFIIRPRRLRRTPFLFDNTVMALAEFLKQVALDGMVTSTAKTKSDTLTTLGTSESDKPGVDSTNSPTAISPQCLQPSPETHGLRVSSLRSPRRRPLNQASPQQYGRKNRRRNGNPSTMQPRQRSHRLIDELWSLIPEEHKRAVEGQYVSRTEKIEMAIEVLKNFQDHQRV